MVGRRTELAALLDVLDASAAGRRSAALVSGDAGVGKTRLLSELLGVASGREQTLLVGQCIEMGEVGLPYLPFTEAFGRLARQDEDLVAALVHEFRPIARLLPQHRVLGAAPAEPGDNRMDRSELFNAVLGALGRVGERAPTLLLVEDVHWADQSTRDLLGFLLARLDSERVCLVVSYRSDDLHRRHPLRPALAEWSRRPGVHRVELAPLPDDAVRELIRDSDPTLAEPRIRQVIERAEGNAFFTEELLAAGERCLEGPAVPTALADLLLVRLDRLSDDARDVVRLAAVAGRRIPHGVLEVVAERPHRELDAALREAIDAHVLEPSGHDRYGFRHALLGEAVYDDLLPGERVRLHAAFVAAMTKQNIPGTAAELARHALQSHDVPTAFSASVRAAEEALAVGAPQEAMQQYEAAMELLPRVDVALESSLPDSVTLALETADAAALAGHLSRAVAISRDALSTLPPSISDEQRADVLYGLALHCLAVEGELESVEATGEALRLIPVDPPSPRRARLSALHARTMSQLGRHDDAVRWAHEALDLADALHKPDIATGARTTLAVEQKRAGHPEEAAEQLELIAEQARRAGQIGEELRILFQLGVLRLGIGDLEGAQAAYTRCWRRAVDTGRQWALYGLDARLHLAIVQFVAGEWDASLQTTDLGGQNAPQVAALKLRAFGMPVRAARGDQSVLGDVASLRKRWRDDGAIAVWALTQAMELHTQLGDTAAALADADELIAVITDIWQTPWFAARLRMSALAIAAIGRTVAELPDTARPEAVERAAAFHHDGHEVADRSTKQGVPIGPEGRAWLARLDAEWGRLRWLTGIDAPPLPELLETWKSTATRFSSEPYEHARSLARLAELQRAAGDASVAASTAEAAMNIARRLGARPLIDDLATVIGGDSRAAPASGMGALTGREQDVVQLLVDGRSNRQIARQLYISEKTVSVHVSNILAKLGVRSRTEAAAVARRQVDPPTGLTRRQG